MLRLPQPARLLNQFLIGMVWFGFLAFVAAQLTRAPFLLTFAGILGLALSGALLGSLAVVRRVERGTPSFQYGIAFLLGLTLYLAVFLGAVRWLLLTVGEVNNHRLRSDPAEMVAAWVFCAFLLVFSMPITFGLLDALVWVATWLVRKSWLRGALVRIGRRRLRR